MMSPEQFHSTTHAQYLTMSPSAQAEYNARWWALVTNSPEPASLDDLAFVDSRQRYEFGE